MVSIRASLVIACMTYWVWSCVLQSPLQAQQKYSSFIPPTPPEFDLRNSTLIREPKTKVGDLEFTLKANKKELEMREEITFEYAIHNSGKEAVAIVWPSNGVVYNTQVTKVLAVFDESGQFVDDLSTGMKLKIMPTLECDVRKLHPESTQNYKTTVRFGRELSDFVTFDPANPRFKKAGKYYVQFIILDRALAPNPFAEKGPAGETDLQRTIRQDRQLKQFLIDNPGRVVAASEPWELNVTLPKAVAKKP